MPMVVKMKYILSVFWTFMYMNLDKGQGVENGRFMYEDKGQGG